MKIPMKTSLLDIINRSHTIIKKKTKIAQTLKFSLHNL